MNGSRARAIARNTSLQTSGHVLGLALTLAAALLLEPVDAVLAGGVSVLVYGAATLSLRVVRPLDVKLLLGRAA